MTINPSEPSIDKNGITTIIPITTTTNTNTTNTTTTTTNMIIITTITGIANISITFNDVSMNHENKKFLLVFEVDYPGITVLPVMSLPMFIVRYKLVIIEENKAPYVWYKDEGGRDKCIDLVIELRNHKDEVVTGNIYHNNTNTITLMLLLDRVVPLKATLMYAPDGATVSIQQILIVSPESKLTVNGNTKGNIRFRISEVSSRHRGQLFQILVSPDVSQAPTAADIAPSFSMSIDVKSKRNNIHRGIHCCLLLILL